MCETSFSAYIHVNYLIQVNPLMHTYFDKVFQTIETS